MPCDQPFKCHNNKNIGKNKSHNKKQNAKTNSQTLTVLCPWKSQILPILSVIPTWPINGQNDEMQGIPVQTTANGYLYDFLDSLFKQSETVGACWSWLSDISIVEVLKEFYQG